MFSKFDILGRQIFFIFVLDHERRKVLGCHATLYPSAVWAENVIKDVYADRPYPRHMITDNDPIFRYGVHRLLEKVLKINHVRTAKGCPWQNGVAERMVRTFKDEVIRHIPLFGVVHASKIIREYAEYYNKYRPHLTLGGDSPCGRPIDLPPAANSRLKRIACCCGLQSHYRWAS